MTPCGRQARWIPPADFDEYVRARTPALDTALVPIGDDQDDQVPVVALGVTPEDGPPQSAVIAYHSWRGCAAQERRIVSAVGPGETIESIAAGTDRLSVVTTTGTRTFQCNPADPFWFEVGGR
jgi:hypothetical protein